MRPFIFVAATTTVIIACSGQPFDAQVSSGAQPAAEPAGQCIVADRLLREPPGPFERGLAVWVGEGAPRDPAAARKLLAEACDAGTSAACTVLGLMVETGEGGPKGSGQELLERGGRDIYDLGGCEQAAPPLSLGISGSMTRCCRVAKGCAVGCATSCAEAGKLVRERTLGVIERGCRRGIALACHVTAVQYAYGAYLEPIGPLLEQDPVRAQALFESACAQGIARSCSFAGRELMPVDLEGAPPGDAPRGLTLLRRACDLGDGYGCYLLANEHRWGKWTPVDRSQALLLYRKACSLGMTAVCEDLRRGVSLETESP